MGDSKGFKPFLCQSIDSGSVTASWKKWKLSFKIHCSARTAKPSEAGKRDYFLDCAGEEVQDVYFSLVSEDQWQDHKMEDAIAVLDDYFCPQSNVTYERHVFRQISQKESETVDQFISRLRQQAKSCEFSNGEDEQIRDQVVDRVRSAELRRKFLECQGELTLSKVRDIARAYEAVESQLARMSMRGEPSSSLPTPSVNAVQSENKTKVRCYSCNEFGHVSRDDVCKAKNRKCNKCGKIGHYEIVCRGAQRRGNPQDKSGSGSRSNGKAKSRRDQNRQSVHHVMDESVSNSEEYVYSVTDGEAGFVTANVSVGGVQVSSMLIDSGASVNVISEKTWKYLKSCKVKVESQTKSATLFAYGSSRPLETLGKFSAVVESHDTGSKVSSEFVVVQGQHRSLLSKKCSEALGLLRVGPSVNQVDSRAEALSKAVLQEKYGEVFQGVGKLQGYELSFNVDQSVKPVAQPVRRIPFGLRQKVDEKLDQLLKDDIIEEVPEGPSSWISPIQVEHKSNGSIRLCIDMRQANKAIVRERQPMPTVEELLLDLNGSVCYSHLDFKDAFNQVVLSPSSRDITTFITHRGLYRYKRLMFGVNSAPEKFNQLIRDLFRDCVGVSNLADDVIVYGSTVEEHNQRLTKVMERIRDAGLTLNMEKCIFGVDKITFFGHEITGQGIGPNEEKVAAIRDAQPPVNLSEVRSFLGLVQYVGKFLPNLSTVIEPIQALVRGDNVFQWNVKHQAAFDKVKQMITSTKCLAFFDNDAPTRLVCDASPTGLGAVLLQCKDNVWRAISYASRRLTDVERRYSQTEKEALAVVWSCERFYLYLIGREFEIETDHKPLEFIYSPKSKPSARVERWVLRLSSFSYKLVHRPGRQNIADCLSRLNPKVERDKGECVDFVHNVCVDSSLQAISLREVEQASGSDSEFEILRKCIKSSDFSLCPNVAYTAAKYELCCYGMLILRGSRILIPKVLRDKVMSLAHEGHLGTGGTKARLREHVWWPGMDKDVERFLKGCMSCQAVSGNCPEPIKVTVPPERQWVYISCDFVGPLKTGEYLLVVYDYYSRWIEVGIVTSTSFKATVTVLESLYARYGLPVTLKTDNGPPFNSQNFKDWCESLNVEHITSPPRWPQANGGVERHNQTLLKALKIAVWEKNDWRGELRRRMEAYRSAAREDCGKSPAEMHHGFPMRTKIPSVVGVTESRLSESSVERDSIMKYKVQRALREDERRGAKHKVLEPGASVLVEQQKTEKLSPRYVPGIVVRREEGGVVVMSPDASLKRRSASQIKEIPKAPPEHSKDIDVPPEVESRPRREVKPPDWLKDYTT